MGADVKSIHLSCAEGTVQAAKSLSALHTRETEKTVEAEALDMMPLQMSFISSLKSDIPRASVAAERARRKDSIASTVSSVSLVCSADSDFAACTVPSAQLRWMDLKSMMIMRGHSAHTFHNNTETAIRLVKGGVSSTA